MEEEREYLVLPEVSDVETAKSELVLGLRLLSFSGVNLFDRQTLLYEINVAKCLDETKELSEDSHQRYHQVVIEAFKNKDLPLNEQGQASVDDIITTIDVKLNLLGVEEPIEGPSKSEESQSAGRNYVDSSNSRQGSFVERGNKETVASRNSSLNAVPEVFRVSILKQDDKQLLEKLARDYFSPHLSNKSKLADRNSLIDFASSLLLKNPALNNQVESVLRDNKTGRIKFREIDRLMIDIHSSLDLKQDAKIKDEKKDEENNMKFAWVDENTLIKSEEYLLEKFERALAEYTSSIVNDAGWKDQNKSALIEAGVELVQGYGNQEQALFEIKEKLSDSILTRNDLPLAQEIEEGIMEKLKGGPSLGK